MSEVRCSRTSPECVGCLSTWRSRAVRIWVRRWSSGTPNTWLTPVTRCMSSSTTREDRCSRQGRVGHHHGGNAAARRRPVGTTTGRQAQEHLREPASIWCWSALLEGRHTQDRLRTMAPGGRVARIRRGSPNGDGGPGMCGTNHRMVSGEAERRSRPPQESRRLPVAVGSGRDGRA